MKKILVVIVVLLFIGVIFAPSINANVRKEILVRFPVTEYKEDGTKETSIIKMSWSDLMVLKTKLQTAKDSEEILLLYKEYGLVPKDASLSKMRNGMLRLAERLNVSVEKISLLISSNKSLKQKGFGFAVNLQSFVSLLGFLFVNVPIGLSFITGPINAIIKTILLLLGYPEVYLFIPSVDILQFYFMPVISYLTAINGKMPDFEMQKVICLLIGFVGFFLQFPILSFTGSTFGYSVATIAFGYIM